MSTKVNKTISIDESLNSITKEMPNFSGFVQQCLISYSQGNLEVDWDEIASQSTVKLSKKQTPKFGVVEFGAPTKMQYMGVGGSREERERFAGFIPRTCALLIDLILISVPSILLSLVASGVASSWLWLVIGLIYPVVFTSSSWQATPGKRLLGLIITDYDGNGISLQKAVKRHCWVILIFISFGFGYIAQVWTDHKQTNQDLMARTLVVKKGMDNWID